MTFCYCRYDQLNKKNYLKKRPKNIYTVGAYIDNNFIAPPLKLTHKKILSLTTNFYIYYNYYIIVLNLSNIFSSF